MDGTSAAADCGSCSPPGVRRGRDRAPRRGHEGLPRRTTSTSPTCGTGWRTPAAPAVIRRGRGPARPRRRRPGTHHVAGEHGNLVVGVRAARAGRRPRTKHPAGTGEPGRCCSPWVPASARARAAGWCEAMSTTWHLVLLGLVALEAPRQSWSSRRATPDVPRRWAASRRGRPPPRDGRAAPGCSSAARSRWSLAFDRPFLPWLPAGRMLAPSSRRGRCGGGASARWACGWKMVVPVVARDGRPLPLAAPPQLRRGGRGWASRLVHYTAGSRPLSTALNIPRAAVRLRCEEAARDGGAHGDDRPRPTCSSWGRSRRARSPRCTAGRPQGRCSSRARTPSTGPGARGAHAVRAGTAPTPRRPDPDGSSGQLPRHRLRRPGAHRSGRFTAGTGPQVRRPRCTTALLDAARDADV